MRPIPRVVKSKIIVVVLVLAFVTSTLLAIVVSVNLAVPIQNSNRDLDNWVTTLQSKGYSLFYANFNPAWSTVKAESITAFEKLLVDHKVTEAQWHWTEMALPFQIVYEKIWFTDKETTYYLETSW